MLFEIDRPLSKKNKSTFTRRKRFRFGLVLKSVLILFILSSIAVITFIYNDYLSEKEKYLKSIKRDSLYVLEILKQNILLIKNSLDTASYDLSNVFLLMNPDNQQKLELLKKFGQPVIAYGLGYATPPGKNSFTQYIYQIKVNGQETVFNNDISKFFPDYYTDPSYLIPKETGKIYVEPPTKNIVRNCDNYMVTVSYPFIKQNVFQGVFVFDIDLEWLILHLAKSNLNNNIHFGLFFKEEKYKFFMLDVNGVNIQKLPKSDIIDRFTNKIINSSGKNYFKQKLDNYTFSGISEPVFDDSMYILDYYDEKIIDIKFQNILYRELIIGMIVLVIIFIALFLVIKFSLRPVVQISNNVRKIAKGDLGIDVSVNSKVIEVIRLEEAIKKMQIHLRHYITKIQKNAELNTEIKIARDIQMSVIPKANPTFEKFPNFDLCHFFKSTKEVSGDFYNYYMLDDDNIFISIGDVTGKGIPACLYTLMMVSMEKMFPDIPLTMGETLKLVNLKLLSMNEEVNNFISYFCMVINLKTGESRYSSAGHDLPYVRRKNGKIAQLEKCKGTFLGLFEFMEFTEKYYTFEPGDILFAFTDGVTEAMNSERKMFGKENLLKAIAIESNQPTEIIKNVDSSIIDFVGKYPQSDDICITCFKFDK